MFVFAVSGLQISIIFLFAWHRFSVFSHASMFERVFELLVLRQVSPARRFLLSSKIFRRSIPRIITWCSTPGASSRANLGMSISYLITFIMSSYLFIYARPA